MYLTLAIGATLLTSLLILRGMRRAFEIREDIRQIFERNLRLRQEFRNIHDPASRSIRRQALN